MRHVRPFPEGESEVPPLPYFSLALRALGARVVVYGGPYDTFRAEAMGEVWNREGSVSCVSSQQSHTVR